MSKSVSTGDLISVKSTLVQTAKHNSQVVYKHYQRALAQWPKDILRPNVSFQNAMQRRIDRQTTPPTEHRDASVIANDALTTVPTAARFDENAELQQVNVLYSFLENRYTKKVLMSWSHVRT